MRTVAFILSFYLLFLTLFPCVDKDLSFKGYQYELSGQKSETGHRHIEDHCSPLCMCNCCAMVIEFTTFSPEVANLNFYAEIQFHFNQAFLSFFASNIWQPPKIG
jgi:hypothetical protein